MNLFTYKKNKNNNFFNSYFVFIKNSGFQFQSYLLYYDYKEVGRFDVQKNIPILVLFLRLI